MKSQINLKPTFQFKRKQYVVLLWFFPIAVLFANRQEINLKGAND